MLRLERRGRGAAGDVVAQLVERVAHGQLGRDLGDREAGGLRGQRRRTRHARVHLDDDHAAVLRVDRELHVRAAGVDADLAQDRERGVAQDLVFLVGQRLRRGHGDRVAGVHAHRVEVLDRADDDAVVRACRARLPSRTLSSRAAIPRSAARWSARLRGRACRWSSNSSGL